MTDEKLLENAAAGDETAFVTLYQRHRDLVFRFAYRLLQSPESAVAIYTFNKHVIKHHFCPKCGCAPFGFGESRGTQMAAVNVRCLEDVELASIKRQFVDGRSF